MAVILLSGCALRDAETLSTEGSDGQARGTPVAEQANAVRPGSPREVTDLDLKPLKSFPGSGSNGLASVYIFVRPDCPIANRYAPEIRRLRTAFQEKIGFWLVYPDDDVTPAIARRHLEEHSLGTEALLDPGHKLVRMAQARVTPEAAVFSAGGELLYHGRIDNRFVAFGTSRPEPTRRDLEEVLSALAAGRRPEVASTPAVGCTIALSDEEK